MNLSDIDRAILLDFQRAHFAFTEYPGVAAAAYYQARRDLKLIREPVIKELVRRMFQEWTFDRTSESYGLNPERAADIMSAEAELYNLSFTFGNNCLPKGQTHVQ
jgi:hypothetical protein